MKEEMVGVGGSKEEKMEERKKEIQKNGGKRGKKGEYTKEREVCWRNDQRKYAWK